MTNEEIRERCEKMATTELDDLLNNWPLGPRAERIANEVRNKR